MSCVFVCISLGMFCVINKNLITKTIQMIKQTETCGINWPEWSSFTSDDIVFVIESAATNRSFRRFLGTPRKQRHFHIKLRTHAVSSQAVSSCSWSAYPAGRIDGLTWEVSLEEHASLCSLEFYNDYALFQALAHSHPEQRPQARPLPPLPGSPAACELGWTPLRWSVWAWAWSSPHRDWVKNEGSLQTGTAT